MYQRIMVTGIPSYLSNTITKIDGMTVYNSSRMPDQQTKSGFMKAATSITNTGNYLIGEGALDCLPRETTTFIPFWHLVANLDNPEFLRRLQAGFDVCVFTAANLIRSDFSADIEAQVLERIRLPIVVLGIGIQRISDLESPLPAGTRNFIRLLAEQNAFVFTRGHETANFLQSQGVRNANASGCPSMFHLSANVIKAWRFARDTRIGANSQLVFSGYFGHESHYETARDINRLVDRGGRCAYVLQDEMVTYGLTIHGGENDLVYDFANGQIIAPVGFPHQEKIHAKLDLHCFFDSTQWRAWIAHATFALQRRFHGSIVALQAGVPSLMIALDDRMREMLNFIGFPYIQLSDWIEQEDKRGYLNTILAELQPDAITDEYVQRRDAFMRLLYEAELAPTLSV